ncbi:30S ribosomal protein S6 [bacterium]|nr:30S ribosomal protein S6 [bacterium]
MVLHPEMPEAQIRETIDRAKRLIEESGGKIHEVQEWGIRELAYPIRKLHRGYYVLVEYDSNADVVREFERTLKIADEVLRFVSVATVTTKPKTKPGKARRPVVDADIAAPAGE